MLFTAHSSLRYWNMALYAASCSRRFTEDSWANMKRGSDLEDPVRAVAIPRPDARGIVTANMLNKSECGTHGGPAAYHSLSHSLLKWNSADSGVLVSRGWVQSPKTRQAQRCDSRRTRRGWSRPARRSRSRREATGIPTGEAYFCLERLVWRFKICTEFAKRQNDDRDMDILFFSPFFGKRRKKLYVRNNWHCQSLSANLLSLCIGYYSPLVQWDRNRCSVTVTKVLNGLDSHESLYVSPQTLETVFTVAGRPSWVGMLGPY